MQFILFIEAVRMLLVKVLLPLKRFFLHDVPEYHDDGKLNALYCKDLKTPMADLLD